MRLLDTVLDLFVPHTCLGCGVEGQLLCGGCVQRLIRAPERCYSCQASSEYYLTCHSCRGPGRLHIVQPATVYGGLAKALIWKFKLSGARSAAGIMACCLAPYITDDNRRALIVPVPTATSRQRQRGYDQARLLARELARQNHLRYADLLARSGQTHQHGLSRSERLAQLSAAFRPIRPAAIREEHIILVDDVVTTGATLEAAAAVLYAAGAVRIDALVFAQA